MKRMAWMFLVVLLIPVCIFGQESRRVEEEGVLWHGDTLNAGRFDQLYVIGDRLLATSLQYGASLYGIDGPGEFSFQEFRPRGLDYQELYLVSGEFLFGFRMNDYWGDYFEIYSMENGFERLTHGPLPYVPYDPHTCTYKIFSMADSMIVGSKDDLIYIQRITPDLQIVPHDTLNITIWNYLEYEGLHYITSRWPDNLLSVCRFTEGEFELVDSVRIPQSGEYPAYPVQTIAANDSILALFAWQSQTQTYTNIIRYRFNRTDPLHPVFIDTYDFGVDQRFHYLPGVRTSCAISSTLNDSVVVFAMERGVVATINNAFGDTPEVLDTLHVLPTIDYFGYAGNTGIRSLDGDVLYLPTEEGIQTVDLSDLSDLHFNRSVQTPMSVDAADQAGNRLALLQDFASDSCRLTLYDRSDNAWNEFLSFDYPLDHSLVGYPKDHPFTSSKILFFFICKWGTMGVFMFTISADLMIHFIQVLPQ